MKQPELSIIILSANEDNLADKALDRIQSIVSPLSISTQYIAVGTRAGQINRPPQEQDAVDYLQVDDRGYGAALRAGIAHAAGRYTTVLEADQADMAQILVKMWEERDTADIVIASRYVAGGQADMPWIRRMVSRVLNIVFSRGLDLRVRDMSSGVRLYDTQLISSLNTVSHDYDILQEILVKSLMEGYAIREIPFAYHSHNIKADRLFQIGRAYLRTFTRLWRLRNSIASADYDARAYYSLVPPQRYWQRQRYRHITRMIAGQDRCVDVGCGSSQIIGALPPGSIAMDIALRKLRYARRYGKDLTQSSLFALPLGDGAVPCVICSQVIEHIPRTGALEELDRVLMPGGFLVLGTPDYGKWQWQVIERLYKLLLPQAYADEHITHYTYDELIHEFVDGRGYTLEAVQYILQGELILGLRKPDAGG